MTIPSTSGVYLLRAINTKLIYIGSSKNLQQRKNIHLYHIKKNNKDKGCGKIIDAINLEKDIVEFSVLELCENYIEREQFWIDFYKSQNELTLVNVFDAVRLDSNIEEDFKQKMSEIRKEKWKDPTYRENQLSRLQATQLSAEKLNKEVCVFKLDGTFFKNYPSAKILAEHIKMSNVSVGAAARGSYRGSHRIGNYIFIYKERVLNKLDELLETHHELRAISSQAWEASKTYQEGSTTNQ